MQPAESGWFWCCCWACLCVYSFRAKHFILNNQLGMREATLPLSQQSSVASGPWSRGVIPRGTPL